MLHYDAAGGEPVATMCAAFEKRRDYVVRRLKAIEGIKLAAPEGAFYVFPDVSGLVGDGCEVGIETLTIDLF